MSVTSTAVSRSGAGTRRQAPGLAALLALGLAAAGCAGPADTQQAQMGDTPFWHEEPQED